MFPSQLSPRHVLSDLFVEDLVGPSRTNLLFAGALHVLNNAFLDGPGMVKPKTGFEKEKCVELMYLMVINGFIW